jgi:RHS repeat-associated protein
VRNATGVMVVHSDKRIAVTDGQGQVLSYRAEVLTITNYYPFGMPLAERTVTTAEGYRYGFNGQEKETEITGSPSHTSAEFWMYDTRLGRRWNVDPLEVEWESPYATMRSNPIVLNDPNGDCPDGNCGENEILAAQSLVDKLFDSTQGLKDISNELNSAASQWYTEQVQNGTYCEDSPSSDMMAFIDLVSYLWGNTVAMSAQPSGTYDGFKSFVYESNASTFEKANYIVTNGENYRQQYEFFFGLLIPTVTEFIVGASMTLASTSSFSAIRVNEIPRFSLPSIIARNVPKKAGHLTPWAEMTEAEKIAFKHSYTRHWTELGLPGYKEGNMTYYQGLFNDAVTKVRYHGVNQFFVSKANVNGVKIDVIRTEPIINGQKYYYYETLTGKFVSVGKFE